MVDNTKFVGWIGRRRGISTAVLGAALAALTVLSDPLSRPRKPAACVRSRVGEAE